jgi:Pyridine nucleotide-disulphide oxidoreductase
MANSEQRLCIIGSGPAGCYVAEHLLKLLPDARIDILEKLPVPFGLIRYGVAPDHQSTKGAARVLDRTLSRDRVRFFGNVEVGRDITLHELRAMYHAVVLATGAPRDRKLGIPGEELPNVIGSAAFVSWYNGHPSRITPELHDVRSAVILGNGNVALDVARILAKHGDELKGSDLTPDVLAALRSQPIEDIHIVGRRSAADAKFNEHELEELGTLQQAKPAIEDTQELLGDTPVQKVLQKFATESRPHAPVTIHFHFGLTSAAFIGDTQLEAVSFRSNAGNEVSIPAQLAVTCIGYEAVPCCSASPANGVFANDAGKIDGGLYVVGWAKRGPSGTIPTNRAEALDVAQKITSELAAGPKQATPDLPAADLATPDLAEVLQSRGVVWVDYAGWKRIEAAERAGACDERCRLKILRAADMLQVAQQDNLQLRDN